MRTVRRMQFRRGFGERETDALVVRNLRPEGLARRRVIERLLERRVHEPLEQRGEPLADAAVTSVAAASPPPSPWFAGTKAERVLSSVSGLHLKQQPRPLLTSRRRRPPARQQQHEYVARRLAAWPLHCVLRSVSCVPRLIIPAHSQRNRVFPRARLLT